MRLLRWVRWTAQANALAPLRASIRRFTAARSAVAAVEFAIVLPVALMLYIGASEVTQGVVTARKVALLTRTLVDVISQQPTSQQAKSTPTPSTAATATTLSAILTSAQVLLSPQPTTSLQMTLSAVDVVNIPATGICCRATVRWSYTQGGTLRPCNQALTAGSYGTTNALTTLPPGLMPTGSVLPAPIAIIIADVNYTFQPIFYSKILPFAPTMARNEYMFPRTTGQVVTASLPASGPQHGAVCY